MLGFVSFLNPTLYLRNSSRLSLEKILKSFVVLPKRWLVEKTFGWFNWCRRLSKDYEILPETTETFVYVAMIRVMLKQLTVIKITS